MFLMNSWIISSCHGATTPIPPIYFRLKNKNKFKKIKPTHDVVAAAAVNPDYTFFNFLLGLITSREFFL